MTIPVFPLTGAVLFPGTEIPLNIFESKYVNMVNDALADKRVIGLVQPEQRFYSKLIRNNPLYKVGCAGKIKAFNETDDGKYLIVLGGISRFELSEEISSTRGYRKFKVSYENFKQDLIIKKLRQEFALDLSKKDLVNKVDNYLKNQEANYSGLTNVNELLNVEPAFLVDFLCSYLPFSPQEKQLFIESKTIEDRAKALYKVLGMADAESKLITHNTTMH